MKAKSKKWAGESLVSETEKKAIPTPKQQREAGVITGAMVAQALGGALIPSKIKPKSKDRKIFEKEISQKLTKKDSDISPSKQKETNAKLLEIYKKTGSKKYRQRIKRHKAEGGPIKKYSNGGSVRKARF